VRELTCHTRAISIDQMTKELAWYLRGWTGYLRKCPMPVVLKSLEEWTWRRLWSAI
jgi:RNA-directed DNA polymerase